MTPSRCRAICFLSIIRVLKCLLIFNTGRILTYSRARGADHSVHPLQRYAFNLGSSLAVDAAKKTNRHPDLILPCCYSQYHTDAQIESPLTLAIRIIKLFLRARTCQKTEWEPEGAPMVFSSSELGRILPVVVRRSLARHSCYMIQGLTKTRFV